VVDADAMAEAHAVIRDLPVPAGAEFEAVDTPFGGRVPTGPEWRALMAAHYATYDAGERYPTGETLGTGAAALHGPAEVIGVAAALGRGAETTRTVTAIFRDIIGDPFRPVAIDPSWVTSTVVALARQMYESRDFSLMLILADALQDAGCDNEDVLNHCRGGGVHVRGCFVIDLFLGRSSNVLTTWLAVGLLAGGLPPLLPDPALTPLRRLQREVVAARRERVEVMLKAIQDRKSDSFAETGKAVRLLADAEVELTGDPAAGVKWAEQWHQILRTRVRAEEQVFRTVDVSLCGFLEVVVVHTEAEIDLLRRREAVKGGSVVNPEDKLKLFTKRVEVLTRWERSLKELVARGSGRREDLLPVTIARADAEIELVKLKESMAKKDK
jgi:hypothetical protein